MLTRKNADICERGNEGYACGNDRVSCEELSFSKSCSVYSASRGSGVELENQGLGAHGMQNAEVKKTLTAASTDSKTLG